MRESISFKEETSQTGNRLYFLDNLRTIIIFLVVLYHVGIVYESSGVGAVFWIVDDPATNDLVGILNLILDIFVMPTMFLISGYLAPMSLSSKTAQQFLVAKAKRLVVPWMISVLTLIPLYKAIFLYSRNLPQDIWTSYFHSSNGIFSQSWLWFLPVLFLFELLYLLLTRLNVAPTKVSLRLAIVTIFVVGFATSVGMDLLKLRGWTKTPLLDFQNEKLLVYFMFFLLGSLCSYRNVFLSPSSKKLYTIISSTAWIPINAYLLFILFPLVTEHSFLIGPVIDRLIVWLTYYASLFSLVYVVVESSRRYLNRSGAILRQLSQNSYNVYIIHVIILGAFALPLLSTPIPSLLKYLILASATYAVCNVIVSLYRLATKSRHAESLGGV